MRERERRVGSRAERLDHFIDCVGRQNSHIPLCCTKRRLVGIRHLSSVLPRTLLPIQGLAGPAKGGWLIRSHHVVEAAKPLCTSVEPALSAASGYGMRQAIQQVAQVSLCAKLLAPCTYNLGCDMWPLTCEAGLRHCRSDLTRASW